MESKHTPGSWKSVMSLGKKLGVRDSGGFICFLTTPNHYTGQDERYFQEMSEWQANAALIASAPDLLHAAKSALEILSRPAIFPQDIEAMRKMLSEAIKKSEPI